MDQEPDVTVEVIVDEDFSMADYLPEDHCMNDASCTCAACTMD